MIAVESLRAFVDIVSKNIFTNTKVPEGSTSGTDSLIMQNMQTIHLFFHPDCTVGSGITPDQPFGSRTITAGREFHPALKNVSNFRL